MVMATKYGWLRIELPQGRAGGLPALIHAIPRASSGLQAYLPLSRMILRPGVLPVIGTSLTIGMPYPSGLVMLAYPVCRPASSRG